MRTVTVQMNLAVLTRTHFCDLSDKNSQRHQFTAIKIVQCTHHGYKRAKKNEKIGATKATTQEINAANAN